MQYSVPQFIEVEDKIVGPLTFKQALYLVGGAGISYLISRFLPLYLAIIVAAPIVILALMLAFYKINNRPFVFILESGINYFLRNKLYLWSHDYSSKSAAAQQPTEPAQQKNVSTVPRITEGKLRDLAWSLDVQETPVNKQK